MRLTACLAALLAAAFAATAASAQVVGPVDPGAQVEVSKPKGVTINGVTGVRVRETPGASQGYMVPDAKGGYVYYQPGPPVKPLPSHDDAEEVRLYARELAAQITGGISGDAPLVGVISIPTAFVDQDTRLATSFGRLMGEQMIYELNSRGFPVQEARGVVPRTRGRGAPVQAQAVLAGTYYVDRDNLYVNARLVEPSGRVIRTGSVLIPMTDTLRRMLGIPVPDPSGLRPTLPTLIGARDVNDPPGGCGYREAMPYSPMPKKKAPARRAPRAAVKKPCPPGCEAVDAPPRTAAPKASKASKTKEAAPQPEAQPQPASPAQPSAQPQPAPPPPAK